METTEKRSPTMAPALPPHPPGGLPDGDRQEREDAFGLFLLTAVYRWRALIVSLTVLTAAGAVALALSLPNEYLASARLLSPDNNSSLLSSMFGRSASAAARFLGSGTQAGQYTRFIAILSARSTFETVVDSFRLADVYEVADEQNPRAAAVAELQSRATFGVDDQYEFLEVSVLDRDPRRAAAMANLFVRELNRTSVSLSTRNAANYRRFIEVRYRSANVAVDSLLDAVKAFQGQYGVYNLPAQTQAYYAQLGSLRAEQARLQIQYEAVRSQAGPENPEVQGLRAALDAAQREYGAVLAGSERSLPVAQGRVPEVARRYAELERRRQLQQSTLEVITPMYEAARMEEGRAIDAVQVLDYAVPPAKKSAPGRTVIVVAATASAFLLGLLFAVARELWALGYRRFAERVRAAVARPEPR